MKNATIDGAAIAASKPITEEIFYAITGELYDLLAVAEGRLDDLERTRDGQDRRVTALLERIAALEQAA